MTTGSRQLTPILLSGKSGTGLIEAVGNDDGECAGRDADAVAALEVECAPGFVQPAATSMTNAAATAFTPKT